MDSISRRKAIIAGTAGIAALSLSGARTVSAANDTLRIGAILSMSGVSARVGKYVRIGAEVACDQINRAGGVNGQKVELVVRDDRSDPNEAVVVTRELNGLGINLFTGLNLASVATAVGGIAQSIDSVIITGSISDALSHELFRPNVFMAAGNNYMRSRALAGVMARKYPEVAVWGGIIPDIAVGHASWDAYAKALSAFYHEAGKDVTVLDPIVTKYGSTDFKNQISQLSASPIEGLFSILQGSDAITFFTQAKALGFDKKLRIVADNSVDLDLADALKKNLPPNIWGVSHWYYAASKGNKKNDEFIAQVIARTGDSYASSLCSVADSGICGFAAAVKAAKSTNTKSVIAALEMTTFESVIGPLRFRKEDHQAMAAIDIVHMTPSDLPPGWKVTEFVHFPAEQSINPPTPGVELKL